MLNRASLSSALRRCLAELRPAHFLPAGLLLLTCLPVTQLAGRYHELADLLPLLPWLLMGLGAALCGVFQRWQQLLLMAWLVVLEIGLMRDVQSMGQPSFPRPAAIADFILATTLWPAIYSVAALWSDGRRPLPELANRTLLLGIATLGLQYLHRHPDLALIRQLGQTWWPALHAGWMRLPQLSYLIAGAGTILLGLGYLLEPRPRHAVSWLILPFCLAILPHVFIHPLLLPSFCSLALLSQMATLVQESLDLAFRDELTGLPSRRALNERLRQLSSQYCLAIVDIDHFKQCNDRHGHDVGDQVLRMVASRLRQGSRGRAYRQGGEEFVIVLDRCDTETARPLLEAIREDIAGYPMQIRDVANRPAGKHKNLRRPGQAPASQRSLSVTISIGLASGNRQSGPADVLKQADKALYKAKAQGRNRTVQA